MIKTCQHLLSRLFVVGCLSCLFILPACQSKSDKDVIAEHVDAMIVAVESESRSDLLDYFSDEAVVQDKLGKRDVGALAFRYFYANDNIKLFVHFLQIDLQQDNQSAMVSARVLVTAGKQTLPERASVFEVKGQWRKIDDDWRISRLNWERIPLERLTDL